MKGFKVSDASRTRTVGIACKSLSELIDKGKTKLEVSEILFWLHFKEIFMYPKVFVVSS